MADHRRQLKLLDATHFRAVGYEASPAQTPSNRYSPRETEIRQITQTEH